jgi:hypothetical protein
MNKFLAALLVSAALVAPARADPPLDCGMYYSFVHTKPNGSIVKHGWGEKIKIEVDGDDAYVTLVKTTDKVRWAAIYFDSVDVTYGWVPTAKLYNCHPHRPPEHNVPNVVRVCVGQVEEDAIVEHTLEGDRRCFFDARVGELIKKECEISELCYVKASGTDKPGFYFYIDRLIKVMGP